MTRKVARWLDPVLLIGLFISIAVAVTMVLSGNDTLSSLIVGLLSTIVTLLIDIVARIQKAADSILAEDQKIARNLEREIERTISSLKGVDIRLFEGRDEYYPYLERRLKQVKRYIDITHSSPYTDTTYSSSERYFSTFSEVVKAAKIKVRRILLVSTQEQMEWVKRMLTEFAGCPFFLGCYPKPSRFIPWLNLFIIDGEEVVISGGERAPSYESTAVSIKHASFAKMAQEHFDGLWRSSLRLNEEGIRDDLLRQLETSLG